MSSRKRDVFAYFQMTKGQQQEQTVEVAKHRVILSAQ
jgi:hypothetical protein